MFSHKARVHRQFGDSDNKIKCFRVFPGHKGSTIVKNLGEGVRGKHTYINQMSLPFPSWSFVVDHLIHLMPQGFLGANPDKAIIDLQHLLETIWDKEDLLHITFSPDYSMVFQNKDPFIGETTYSPWYWLFSEERKLTEEIMKNEIQRDSKGRIKKTGKHSY